MLAQVTCEGAQMPLYACSNFVFIFFVVILIESNFDLVLTVNFKKWIDDDKEFKVDPLGWLKARFLKSFLKTAGNGFDTLVQILVSSVDFSKLLFKSPTTKACNKYGVEDFGDTNPDKTIAVFASFLRPSAANSFLKAARASASAAASSPRSERRARCSAGRRCPRSRRGRRGSACGTS